MNVLYSSSKQMEANHCSIFEGHLEPHRGSISSELQESGIHKRNGGQDGLSRGTTDLSWRTGTQFSKCPRSWCFATVRTVAVSLGVGFCCFLCDCSFVSSIILVQKASAESLWMSSRLNYDFTILTLWPSKTHLQCWMYKSTRIICLEYFPDSENFMKGFSEMWSQNFC